MSKDLIIAVLGFLVAATPLLGFPRSWETVLVVVSGLVISLLAFLLRNQMLKNGNFPSRSDVYIQNGTGHTPRVTGEQHVDEA
jgi:hypothetical protein